MNLYFESSRISATELFPQNGQRLKASSQIFDQALNTPRNKLFSFQVKAALKVTTLGIRMSSTELLLWKNEKGSTCYRTLLKWDFATSIFLEILNFFWISYFKKQLQTTQRVFICLECQMIVVFVANRKSGTRDHKVGPGTQDPQARP